MTDAGSTSSNASSTSPPNNNNTNLFSSWFSKSTTITNPPHPHQHGLDRENMGDHDIKRMLEEVSVPKRIGLSDMNKNLYMLYGSCYILAVETALYPLDTLKVRMMNNKSANTGNSSIFRMAFKLIKREGSGKLWRGLAPSVLGTFPGQSAYYMTYETVHEVLKTQPYFPSLHSGQSTFLPGFIAGGCAESIGGLFYVPSDIISQRLQAQQIHGFTQNSRLYNGPMDVIRKISASEGPRGFFRGYGGYLMAFCPGSAIHWGSYEFMKKLTYKSLTVLEKHDSVPIQVISNKEHICNALSGGIAGFCSVTANNPLEMLRIRRQLLERKSKADAELMEKGYLFMAKQVLAKEGWRGFYKGLKLRLMIVVPGFMISMTGYETVKSWSSLD